MTHWHHHNHAATLTALHTQRQGLTHAEAQTRLAHHGRNVIGGARSKPWWHFFAKQFTDLMIVLLLAAAIISIWIGDAADAIVIGVLVLLNALLGTLQEYRADRALLALQKMSAATAMVVRAGQAHEIAATDIVPGDVVLLEAGRIVPADLRLLQSAMLRINEAALSGESLPTEKDADVLLHIDTPLTERSNMAWQGTAVSHGRGVGLAVATGNNTEFGRIAGLLSRTHIEATPLQKRLADLGRRLTFIVLIICVLVFVQGWLRGAALGPIFMTALSLAVAALPEALPAVMTISLALGARKMMAQHALIRRLPAVETLGSVTCICSDKTGTLTQNRMQVGAYYFAGQLISDDSNTTSTTILPEALLQVMAVSHDATINADGERLGDPTEIALLEAALRHQVDVPALGKILPRINEIPFDTERKRMTTVHAHTNDLVIFSKGAPESVLSICSKMLTPAGSIELDAALYQHAVADLADRGMRVLALAMRTLPCSESQPNGERLEHDMTLLGLVGLLDPPRPEALSAVQLCKQAGITPIMITGDHPRTALSIARQLQICSDEQALLTGQQLQRLSDQELQQRLSDVRVFARVTPEQKLKLVGLLQARGECVAMTGDGVNDAPALRKADIGIAMGITGTDVAKEASAMVLLDDNFATVVRAVREGRRIYDNLRRFIRYVLTTNSAEIWIILLAPLLGLPIPLLPLQILWINLITDGLPGLALAAERAEPDVMQRPPNPVNESVLARGLGLQALITGLLMSGMMLLMQAIMIRVGSTHWQTMVFTAMCFAQLLFVLAIRSERRSLFEIGVLSNVPLLVTVVGSAALQLVLVYTAALQRLFKIDALSLFELLITLLVATLTFAIVEVHKAWLRHAAAQPSS